uniref:L-dopachrome isomerase n=1 Tax=Panagrellus redivivus TaxID=6233 RepID=A0A7E4VTN7_PANRE
MPILTITTNATKSAFPKEDTVLALSKLVAKLTGKPESYVNVIINADAIISFGGSAEPAAYVELASIGGFSNANSVAKALTDAVNQHLKVPKDRFYVKLTDVPASELAFRGQTFG